MERNSLKILFLIEKQSQKNKTNWERLTESSGISQTNSRVTTFLKMSM